MASTDAPLWSTALQKETLDLMTALWPILNEAGRDRLVESILAGPPKVEEVSAEEGVAERRQRWRDREVFERLALLHRIEQPELPPPAAARLEALKLLYPNWKIEAGDHAHFSFLMESYQGRDTDHGADELTRLSGDELLRVLRRPGNEREGRLEVWRNVASARPGRAIGVLRALAADPSEDDAELWRESLFGLRDAISRPVVARRLFAVLAEAPDRMLHTRALLSPACNLIETASKREALAVDEALFWRLWDRLFDNALRDQNGLEAPEDNDWLFQALNRPMGDLATALLNVMFRRGLRAGQGLPRDLRGRFDRLVVPQPHVVLLARVILASRLVFLFAVDRAWVSDRLIPFFDWDRSEDEAAALWRGYASHGRINADLWAAFHPLFLDAFTPARLARLASSAGNLASLLMVVGVELPLADSPTQRVREAIRAMTSDMREQAVSWLCSYLEGPRIENPPPDAQAKRADRADRLWRERVAPWLTRVWPRDRKLIETGTSEKFALLAIATEDAFDEAVAMLLPFMCQTERWGYAIKKLLVSDHPHAQPRSSLALIGKLVAVQGQLYANDLRAVLNRIVEAAPELRHEASFRSLDAKLQAAGR